MNSPAGYDRVDGTNLVEGVVAALDLDGEGAASAVVELVVGGAGNVGGEQRLRGIHRQGHLLSFFLRFFFPFFRSGETPLIHLVRSTFKSDFKRLFQN